MSRCTPLNSVRLLRQPLSRLLAPIGLGLALQSAPVYAAGFFNPGEFNQNNWTSSPSLTACPVEDPASCFTFSSNTSMFIASAPSTTTTLTAGEITNQFPASWVSFTYIFEPANDFQSAYYTTDVAGTQIFSLPPSNGTPVIFSLVPGDQLSFVVSSDQSADPAFLSITGFSYVPAPLPVLGGAAAFGWIRRRRAFLRNSSIATGARKR